MLLQGEQSSSSSTSVSTNSALIQGVGKAILMSLTPQPLESSITRESYLCSLAMPFKYILSAKLSHPQKSCATNTDQKGVSVSNVTTQEGKN